MQQSWQQQSPQQQPQQQQQQPPQQPIPMANPASALPPAMQQQLAQLEQLARAQYSSTNAAERQAAERMLSGFNTNAECISQARLILDHSQDQYALLLAGTSLLKLLTTFFHTFTGAQTLEIRNYLLNYIANTCNTQPPWVLRPLVDTVVRITKLGWRQEPNAPAGVIGPIAGAAASAPGGAGGVTPGSHATIVETCGTFFQHSLSHHCIGLKLLHTLVTEMENALPVESPSDHRKTSRAFRDHALLSILQISVTELRAVPGYVRAGQSPKLVEDVLLNGLHVWSSAFSFDFLGSSLDETTGEDSNITLQVPSTWRSFVEDSSPSSPARLLTQLFDEYAAQSPDILAEILNCFSCLASVRRSLFTNEEARTGFMSFLMEQQIALITKYAGNGPRRPLLDGQIYHEFCRFLARFKYNFSLSDLVKSPSFEPWLQNLYVFTVQNKFGDWETNANSISYLLGVWSRVAADVPQLKIMDAAGNSSTMGSQAGAAAAALLSASQKVQSLILEIVPNICTTFIDARLQSIVQTLQNVDDLSESNAGSAKQDYADLFAEPNLSDQLKYLSVLCRFHYALIKNYLKSKLLPLVDQYKQLLGNILTGAGTLNPHGLLHSRADTVGPFAVAECQLSMLLYIIGAVVGSDKSLMPLHPAIAYASLYPFPGADKITYKDHLELIDAEIVSWVLQVLPIIDARIEKSNITAANARSAAGAAMIQATPLVTMRTSQQHLALSVLSFFNNFRVKWLNTLAHSNYYSYSSSSRTSYSSVHQHLISSNADMAEQSQEPNAQTNPGVPGVDLIAHGSSANIFSRSAFFLQQPLTPHLMLQLLVRQFLTFLNYCSHDEAIIRETLDVFDSLSLNYSTSQQIANLDDVKVFLQSNNAVVGIGSSVSSVSGSNLSADSKLMGPLANGSSSLLISDLHFLQSTKHPKLQTLFYQILSRLVFKGSNIEYFPAFIAPFTFQLQQLAAVSDLSAIPKHALEQVVLLIHKLTGIVSSVNSTVVYQMFFNWWFVDNNFSRLVIQLVETFWTAPSVLHPVLAFYSELIWNKSQRIRFDSSSAGGIILFKETHKIMATYSNRIVMMQKAAIQDGSIGEGSAAAAAVAGGDTSVETAKAAAAHGNALYKNKLKGMSLVLQMLTNVLNGGYCNFGVMAFYKDQSPRTCIKEVLQLAMSVSFDDIQAYPKVALNYFNLLEVLFKNHLELLVEVNDTARFLALVSTLHEGLLSVHSNQQQQAATTIDHLLKWKISNADARAGTAVHATRTALDHHLAQSNSLFPEILSTLFNLYLFDNIDQHWSLSRPILAMLVMLPDSLAYYQHRLLSAQTLPPSAQPELVQKIQAATAKLMNGISSNLEHSNRDKFAQQLSEFRATITAFCSRPM